MAIHELPLPNPLFLCFPYLLIGNSYEQIGRSCFLISFSYEEIEFLDFLIPRACLVTAAASQQTSATEMTMRKSWLLILLTFVFLAAADHSHAAVGCDLNDPDRDVKRLFPESTGYKTQYMSIDQKGGDALLKEIEKLGLFTTIEKGIFADVKRPKDGGKGLAGVVFKDDKYFNPFVEVMKGKVAAE